MAKALSPTSWAMVLAALVASCLPKDTRPPPAVLHTTISSDTPLSADTVAFTTTDGWDLSFEEVLLSVGRVSVEGDACIGYSDPDYARVVDLLRGSGQKVSEVYAIGPCEYDFELSSPHEDSLLGAGVAERRKGFMRIPASDPWVQGAGVSIYVQGRAERAGEEKRFSWAFRNRIDFSTCKATVDGHLIDGVILQESGETTVDLTVFLSTLFQQSLSDGAATWFEPFADADNDENGEVTLEELDNVPLEDVETNDRYADARQSWSTLGDYVYLGLYERVIRYRGNGTCELEIFPNDRVPQ